MFKKIYLLIFYILICLFVFNQKQVFSNSEKITKTYIFKSCKGEKTICNDNFNEKIIISKNIHGNISNIVKFKHPHIKIIKDLYTYQSGNRFTSKHKIINNLGNIFILFIEGNVKPFVASNLKIKLNGNTMAVYKLKTLKNKY